MIGVWNVVRPPELASFADIALGDLLASGSALFAGIAIAALRRARATDASSTIVFYLMAFGTVINLLLILGIPVPGPHYLLIASVTGLLGALGQVTLTIGFAHISAQTGSLVSTSRIVIAGVLGGRTLR